MISCYRRCGRCKTELQATYRNGYFRLPDGASSLLVQVKDDDSKQKVFCPECTSYITKQAPWDCTEYNRCARCNTEVPYGKGKQMSLAKDTYEAQRGNLTTRLVCDGCEVEISKQFKRWEG